MADASNWEEAMHTSICTALAGILSLLSLAACGPSTGSVSAVDPPVGIYDEQVEGSNAVIYADTPEILRYYVPDTGWQEREMEAPEETCTLTLAAASQGAETQAQQFLQGQTDTLTLKTGEFVVVELNGAHWITRTEVGLEAGGPLEVWITDGTGSNRYRADTLTQSGSIAYDARTLCSYLKLQCPETEDLVQISRLQVSGIPTLYEQVLRQLPEDKEVLGARDEENPLSIYRLPLNESVCSLADKLLNGMQDLTDHEKIMVFMQYISEWYVGLDNGLHYLALGSYIESCGGYSNVLAALAATQGLDARIVNLHNYPQNNGHTVCEIYYDGAWHIYDPTHGAFYTSTPENRVSPTVLSYEELSAGKGDSPEITCVVTAPERLTSETSYGFLGPAIYEKANPQGPIGPTQMMFFPLNMDLSTGDSRITRKEYTTAYQGISYIGAANMNTQQLWTIDGLTLGQRYQFILTAVAVGGEIGGDFVARVAGERATIAQNAQHTFNNASPDSMEWVIEFIAQSDTVRLLLSHDYQGPDYHYITTESFELRACS